MSEKRFKYHLGIICEKENEEYNSLTIKEVCDLLNELNDENIELKVQLDVCKKPLFSKRQLHQENQRIKQTIREAYENERTAIGKSVLKQLMEAIQ